VPKRKAETLLDIARVKARREELGLTQEAAALAAGFNGRRSWNNIETGGRTAVTLATLAKLATALKLSPRELLKE
jgi:transcriptional regulator with XRE-family HTH domain